MEPPQFLTDAHTLQKDKVSRIFAGYLLKPNHPLLDFLAIDFSRQLLHFHSYITE